MLRQSVVPASFTSDAGPGSPRAFTERNDAQSAPQGFTPNARDAGSGPESSRALKEVGALASMPTPSQDTNLSGFVA